jgi:hypothetical protein
LTQGAVHEVLIWVGIDREAWLNAWRPHVINFERFEQQGGLLHVRFSDRRPPRLPLPEGTIDQALRAKLDRLKLLGATSYDPPGRGPLIPGGRPYHLRPDEAQVSRKLWSPATWEERVHHWEEFASDLGNPFEWLKENGIEAIAWYRSFHCEPFEHWGIYIRERPVVALALALHDRLRPHGISVPECRWLVMDWILYHEYFHHLTDAALTDLEFRYKVPLFSGAMRMYQNSLDQGDCMEEACANAYSLDKLADHYVKNPGWWRYPAALELISDLMKDGPPSYNQFGLALEPLMRNKAYERLAEQKVPLYPELAQPYLLSLRKSLHGGRVPIRLAMKGAKGVPTYLVDRI